MGKKFRKRFRSVLNIFSCCLHAGQKPKTINENTKLQLLMQKSLEIQIEEYQCQFQMKNTLVYLASLLANFCKGKTKFEYQTDGDALTKGDFGLVSQISQDKAIQSANPSISQTIQTLSDDFDPNDFKLDLLRHMRQLKQDVLLLKQLLCNADKLARSASLEKRDQCELGLIQSKMRALNFVKFYKLRKIEEDKKKNFVAVGSRIRRRCNF